jgi:hypothetical protein
MSFNLEPNPFTTVRDVSHRATAEPNPSGVNFSRQNTAGGPYRHEYGEFACQSVLPTVEVTPVNYSRKEKLRALTVAQQTPNFTKKDGIKF